MDVEKMMSAISDMDEVLAALTDGSSVAVVTMQGSFCPITRGHVQCFEAARHLLLDQSWERPPALACFDAVIGCLFLNDDEHVRQKLAANGQKPLDFHQRAHLVNLATLEIPWLRFSGGQWEIDAVMGRFPKLNFEIFHMNGADDVVAYQKWRVVGPKFRMIVIGRPGFTEAAKRGIESSETPQENCLVGRELSNVSSSQAREACKQGDLQALSQLLCPRVASWMLRSEGREELASVLESTVQELPSMQIAAAASSQSRRDVIVIGICGPSASGKGKLVEGLQKGLGTIGVVLCSDEWWKDFADVLVVMSCQMPWISESSAT
jgi:nicotinic acid mononucleotide adenylyltransferase